MTQTVKPPADRLLLVDDNPTNLQVLLQALEAEGYELLVAQSGEEAISIAKEARPQLILLDINMPGIDGYETCRRLKADTATMESVIVFLSARGDVEDKVKGLELGAVDYIGKPFQFEEVLVRVRKHLEQYHHQQSLRSRADDLEQQLSGGFQAFTDENISLLVAGGEGDRVEFKSTLRKNLHTGKPDKRIESACLKTVAAYLNSQGGVLFVGVDDQGNALGLDDDGFANEDKLLLHWNGLIKANIGIEFLPLTRSTVRDLCARRILVVQCLPSPQPVFLRRDNDELFCVRTGNGSQPLKPSEILAYLAQRDFEPKVSVQFFAKQGQRFGRYAIDEKIGAGGVGVVYRAHHAMLKRPAAIKVLDPNRTNDTTIGRFEREVQSTSQLNHPNTVAIYDYGRTSEGAFFYVMEYLDGITLDDLVATYGPQTEGRVIYILKQICGALAEAHEAGLVHRDIKPANIMVNRRGGMHDVVKLLDFGLVKASNTPHEAALTAPGIAAGTPLFMSPEAVSYPEQVDARSDLYSLGAVAYYLLVGSPVFVGKSILDICKQHVSAQPTPPSAKLGEPISRDLESVVLRCLKKGPAARPQDARELSRALLTCEAAGDWSEEQAAAWWDENRPPK